jgi:integrase
VTARSDKELRKKVRDLLHRADQGLAGSPSAGKLTLEAHLAAWLESIRGTIRDDSWRRHENNIRLHIVPVIGKVKLADLRPHHVVSLVAAIREKEVIVGVGRSPTRQASKAAAAKLPTKKKLGARVVRYCWTTVRIGLRAAVEWGSIPLNPADSIKAPRVPQVEIVAPSPDEVARLLASAREIGDPLLPLYTLAVHSGLRQGECLGLRWADVDLTTGKLTVRRSLKSAKGGVPVYSEGKTARSRRTLKLSSDAVEALRAHHDRQGFERQPLGDDWPDYDLVFVTPVGTPLDAANVRKRLRDALTAAGVSDKYTFHSLRHAAATLMLAAGVNPKVAADRLGHFSAGFTLDRYSHAVQGLDAEAADKVQEVLRRASAG